MYMHACRAEQSMYIHASFVVMINVDILVSYVPYQIQDVKSIQQTIRKHIIHQYKAEFTLHNLRGKLTRATPLFAALVAPVSTVGSVLISPYSSLNC